VTLAVLRFPAIAGRVKWKPVGDLTIDTVVLVTRTCAKGRGGQPSRRDGEAPCRHIATTARVVRNNTRLNRRKPTKGLNTNQVKELNAAWYHAARLGFHLNLIVTFRPLTIDDMTESERCKCFAALRNKLGVYARCCGFPATFAWSREVHPDGTGEHMHVLIHVPTRRRLHFEDTVIRWLPEPGAVDVRVAHYRTRLSASGKRLNVIGYISKQMTPQAWYNRGLIRKPGGSVLGKRAGVSANLTWKAIAAWKRDTAAPPNTTISTVERLRRAS
jgi:hypothetical protein